MENSRHQRETVANIARMVSTARLIAKAHEFADDVPEDVGDPLSALAEILIASLPKLQDDRTEIWRQTLALKEALKDVWSSCCHSEKKIPACVQSVRRPVSKARRLALAGFYFGGCSSP
jgi:hypothetical protein